MSNSRLGLRTLNGSISGIIQGLPTNLLLNSYPADAAFSLRRLNVNYTGNCIRVRRSSDNAEQDIGFVNSQLDTASLLSFVGIGNNGFVTTWYDQSGVIRNATAPVAANQPQIVINGNLNFFNGKPSILLDGNDFFGIALPTYTQLNSYYVINHTDIDFVYPVGTANNRHGWYATQGSTSTLLISSYGSPSLFVNNTLFTGTTRNDVYNFLNGYKLVVHQNAVTGAFWTTFNAIGANLLPPLIGNVQEMIFYGTDQSANRTAIQSNINSYYNIYP